MQPRKLRYFLGQKMKTYGYIDKSLFYLLYDIEHKLQVTFFIK
jgi:hypothetical protein